MPAPNRSMSKREAPVAIISMAQHARPNVIGHNADLRAQLIRKSAVVVIMFFSKRSSIHAGMYQSFFIGVGPLAGSPTLGDQAQSNAPFLIIQMYPTIRIARNTSI